MNRDDVMMRRMMEKDMNDVKNMKKYVERM